ncbi:MAG: glycosyltransferase [Burkholderiales bacterium]|nr:glycosyltransferase [Burkholderiales bacterium]
MSPRRVLLLDTGKEWGGGTNSMLALLSRIDRGRFAVSALFYRDYARGQGPALGAVLAAIGVPLRVLPPAPPPWWEKPLKELARVAFSWNRGRMLRMLFAIERRTRIEPAARTLAALVREGRFELLYLNNQPGSNVEGYLAAAAAGIPAVQHCRSTPALIPEVARIANAHAAKMVCVSEGVRAELLRQGVDAGRCTTVYNGIDCAQALPDRASARAGLDLPADALVLGSVGRLSTGKRVADLIEALAVLARERPDRDYRLLVAGEGPERERLARLAARLALSQRVRLVGFDPEPLRLMAAMDIFALPSASEGMPRVVLEAMLSGRPVVASDIPASRELVVAEQTGILYPCGDVPALAAALARLAADAALRRRMGEAARERLRANFSLERYVAGVESILEAALA